MTDYKCGVVGCQQRAILALIIRRSDSSRTKSWLTCDAHEDKQIAAAERELEQVRRRLPAALYAIATVDRWR